VSPRSGEVARAGDPVRERGVATQD